MVQGSVQRLLATAETLWTAFDRAAARLDRRPWLVLSGCLLLLALLSVSKAVTLPYLYDELFTLRLSELPRFGLVWEALSHGVDLQPPALFVATRAARSVLGNSELATRMPAAVGFGIFIASLFWFVRRRTSALWGAVAVLAVLDTVVHRFCYDARPYGMLLGFSALALLCWQLAADGRWRRLALAGLWLSLALAVSSHYYAVLVFPPLILGEGMRALLRRQIDWAMLASIALAGPVLLFYLPLISGGVSTYADGPWNPVQVGILWHAFGYVFGDAAVPLGLTLVILFLVVETERTPQPGSPGLSLAESVACLGFVALPLFGYMMSLAFSNMMHPRYLLPLAIGFAPLFTFGLWKATNGKSTAAAMFIVVLGGWFACRIAVAISEIAEPASQLAEIAVLEEPESETLPLVFASARSYSQYLQYGSPAVISRAVYVADPERALQHLGTIAVDRNLLVAQPYFSLPLMSWRELREENPRFQLVEREGDTAWLPDEIAAVGARMTLQSKRDGVTVWVVEWSEQPGLSVSLP